MELVTENSVYKEYLLSFDVDKVYVIKNTDLVVSETFQKV